MSASQFGIGVWHPKREINIGTLYRSAHIFGATWIFTVGRRYQPQCSDTTKAHLSIPLFHFDTVESLKAHLPYRCQLIGVELDTNAESLNSFAHPRNCTYMLGAEDHGIPPDVLSQCHQVLTIPSPQPWSLNVATAGSIVCYDRYVKGLNNDW